MGKPLSFLVLPLFSVILAEMGPAPSKAPPAPPAFSVQAARCKCTAKGGSRHCPVHGSQVCTAKGGRKNQEKKSFSFGAMATAAVGGAACTAYEAESCDFSTAPSALALGMNVGYRV